MSNNNNPPFHVGQRVVCVVCFNELSRVWGYNYPNLRSIVIVKSIRKHFKHNFWLITIAGCEVELCHTNFAPIEPRHQDVEIAEELLKEPVPETLDKLKPVLS